MPIIYRELKNEDWPQLLKIVTDIHKEHRDRWPNLYGPTPYLDKLIAYDYREGAFEGDKLVGIILGQKKRYPGVLDSRTMAITHLGVLNGYRGIHIGKGLVSLFQDYCRETGNAKITLSVDSLNVGAVAFYLTMGFAEYKRDFYLEVT